MRAGAADLALGPSLLNAWRRALRAFELELVHRCFAGLEHCSIRSGTAGSASFPKYPRAMAAEQRVGVIGVLNRLDQPRERPPLPRDRFFPRASAAGSRTLISLSRSISARRARRQFCVGRPILPMTRSLQRGTVESLSLSKPSSKETVPGEAGRMKPNEVMAAQGRSSTSSSFVASLSMVGIRPRPARRARICAAMMRVMGFLLLMAGASTRKRGRANLAEIAVIADLLL